MRKLVIAVVLLVPLSAHAYDFTINNQTTSAITALEVSEDGDSWGNFDVGTGIPAGANATATWSESTSNSNCEWQVRAKYADGSVSKVAAFDFCDENLVINFTE